MTPKNTWMARSDGGNALTLFEEGLVGTREARYESDRAIVPLSLMNLDDLARLIETHYEACDTEGRGLLPLTKVYWPVD
jgi:hypothetical protein